MSFRAFVSVGVRKAMKASKRKLIQVIPAKPRKRHWKATSYIISVKIGPAKAMLGAKVYTVTGRALGVRNDGQRFFAELDLPWLWSKRYEWRKIARARLDTFLDPRCTCSAKGKEIVRCDWHREELMLLWVKEDYKSDKRTRKVIDSIPVSEVHPGPISPYRVLYKDWPWVMLDPDLNEVFCDVCKGRQRNWNDSETRMFVNDHSHCYGRVHGTYAKSLAACNISFYGEAKQVIKEELEKAKLLYNQLALAANEIIREPPGAYLPERMSREEVVKHFTELGWKRSGDISWQAIARLQSDNK